MFAALFSPTVTDALALLSAARAFSPRVEEQLGGRLVLIDAAGLGRIVGDAETIARELRQIVVGSGVSGPASRVLGRGSEVQGRGASLPGPHAAQTRDPGSVTPAARTGDSGPVTLGPRDDIAIAIAPTRIAAILLAVGRRGTTVVGPGRTAAVALGPLSLDVFEQLAQIESAKKRPCALCVLCLASHRRARARCGQPGGACTELLTLRRWGLATLGAFAALPAADLAARLGQPGVALQRLARGLDAQPLVPIVEEPRFEASLDFEWPIEDLQPLSFVLTRLLEPLSAALERADRGASAIVTELTLVRLQAEPLATHVRRLELPAPMREARVLRTLVLLDLESHPPPAAVDRLTVRIEPTPGRVVQYSLLERAGPQPETIATLVARLTALMGERRVGSPALVDSHKPGAFELTPFLSEARGQRSEVRGVDALASGLWPPASVLRRFRLPVPARVIVERGRPVRVTTDRIGIKGGSVEECSGPWRSSGGWWSASPREVDGPWSRDEYDVALGDGAAYRIYRDRHEDGWFVEGILD